MRSSDRRGLVRATLALLAAITVGQGAIGWLAYAEEASALGREPQPREYAVGAAQQAAEQCELHQLIVRAAGLAVLLVSAAGAPACTPAPDGTADPARIRRASHPAGRRAV